MNEQVLLFQVTDNEIIAKIRLVLSVQKIGVTVVERRDYNQTIAALAGIQSKVQTLPYFGPPIEGMMMVLCVAPSHLDGVLTALRQAGIPPMPKAILTQTNATWTVPTLFAELMREQEEFRKMKQS